MAEMESGKSSDNKWWDVVADQPIEGSKELRICCEHKAADAFWQYWRENGETHKHGYYESTWGAINAAIAAAGLKEKGDG